MKADHNKLTAEQVRAIFEAKKQEKLIEYAKRTREQNGMINVTYTFELNLEYA